MRAIEQPVRLNVLGLGKITVSENLFAGTFPNAPDRLVFVRSHGGSTVRSELDVRLAQYPGVKVSTPAGFADDQAKWLSSLLAIFYVLLALAIIVSLFGIVNTLVLSTFERTVELGMLRALGMSRRQVRRMVRQESVITALIGAVEGIAVGVFLAALDRPPDSRDAVVGGGEHGSPAGRERYRGQDRDPVLIVGGQHTAVGAEGNLPAAPMAPESRRTNSPSRREYDMKTSAITQVLPASPQPEARTRGHAPCRL